MKKRFATVLVALLTIPTALAAAPSAAIFPFELIDTSYEGEVDGVKADETRRLEAITAELRKLVEQDGRYSVVDVTPLKEEIATAAPLHKCNGCDIELTKKAGAELAMTGTVQKVSNLILTINIYIRDAASGDMKRVMSADMRGNTDESWMRTLRWLVKNRLLATEGAAR